MEQFFLSILFLPLFIITCFFSFLIPGTFLLSILKYKKETDWYILAIGVGVCIFLLLVYITSWLQVPFATMFILAGISVYYFSKSKQKFPFTVYKNDRNFYLLIIFGSFISVGLTWFSGIEIFGNTYFFGINASDGLVHISRIKNLLHSFPPTHPGLSGVSFKGYHYFYDLLISRFSLLYGFSPTDLYFRYFSLFSALFYGVSILYFVKRITENAKKIMLVLMLSYFSAGFIPLLSYLKSGYSAMIAHPILLVFDPSILLSFGLLLLSLSHLPKIANDKKHAILVGIIVGILAQLKVYAGLIGIVVVVLYSVFLLIKFGKKVLFNLIVANAIAAIITTLTYFPNNIGAGSLVFEPLRFYSHYIQQGFFDFLQWENRRLTYIASNNYLYIIVLYTIAVVIYWIITLGAMFPLIAYFPRLFNARFWKNEYYAILAVAGIFTFLVPVFFLQSVAAFDIGQFLWLLLLLLSVPFGFILSEIHYKQKYIGFLICFIFLITAVLQVFQAYLDTYKNSNLTYVVSDEEKEVYSKLSRILDPEEFITVLPKLRSKSDVSVLDPYPSSLAAAMTGRNTYFENEKIDYPQLNLYYSERKGYLFDMHEVLKSCNQHELTQILRNIGSDYLVVLFDAPCIATNSGIVKIVGSENVAAYKLIKTSP